MLSRFAGQQDETAAGFRLVAVMPDGTPVTAPPDDAQTRPSLLLMLEDIASMQHAAPFSKAMVYKLVSDEERDPVKLEDCIWVQTCSLRQLK